MGRHPNPAVDDHTCPACGALPGDPCNTVVDGVQTHWTHDARFLVNLAADIRASRVTSPGLTDGGAA